MSPWRLVTLLKVDTRIMASGSAPNLADAAAAMDRWVGGARASQVAAEWPFLGSVEPAEARERGDKREADWRYLYDNPLEDSGRAFVVRAFHEPRLRELWPYTSQRRTRSKQ